VKNAGFPEARTSAATRSLFPLTNSHPWSLLRGTGDTLSHANQEATRDVNVEAKKQGQEEGASDRDACAAAANSVVE
jgi:hypothetical protein